MINNKRIRCKTVSQSQRVSNGNTYIKRQTICRKRYRSWFYTLNNYKEEDVVSMSQHKWCNLEISRFAFQKEIGENETPHLQGTVVFKNQVSFSTMKRINGRAHWKKCEDLKKCVIYCTKDRTRMEGTKPYLYNIPDSWLWINQDKKWKLRKVRKLDSREIYKNMNNMMKKELKQELNDELNKERDIKSGLRRPDIEE